MYSILDRARLVRQNQRSSLSNRRSLTWSIDGGGRARREFVEMRSSIFRYGDRFSAARVWFGENTSTGGASWGLAGPRFSHISSDVLDRKPEQAASPVRSKINSIQLEFFLSLFLFYATANGAQLACGRRSSATRSLMWWRQL